MQAILDSYICLFHLTTGIFVESVFDAFATAAFFKVVMCNVFELRYILKIWKARSPSLFSSGWPVVRRHLSLLYARICK
jgi:hypothetical protein